MDFDTVKMTAVAILAAVAVRIIYNWHHLTIFQIWFAGDRADKVMLTEMDSQQKE